MTIDVATIPPLTHGEAMYLLEAELERTIAALSALGAADWTTQTDCPDWDVRAMYQHVLGACEAGASMRENVHQLLAARKHRSAHGGPLEAAISAVQVRERAAVGGSDVVARLAALAPRTVRGRRRIPAVMRRWASMKVDGPVHERWRLGYLIDTIYLRDLWMHRIDAACAVGRTAEVAAAHDGRIIADVVAEWARRHGAPFTLELTGSAGGTYVHEPDASGAERLQLDAVEFCRTLAGRVPARGLLATVVPF